MRTFLLLLLSMILFNGFFDSPLSVAAAQEHDEDQDGQDIEKGDMSGGKDDKDGRDGSDFPSLVPSPVPTTALPTKASVPDPTYAPSQPPTITPFTSAPSHVPTFSPSTNATSTPSLPKMKEEDDSPKATVLVESRLPEIAIAMEAGVLSSAPATSSLDMEDSVALDNFIQGMDPFFHRFVETLLTTSLAISKDALQSTTLEIRLIPTWMDGDIYGSSISTATARAEEGEASSSSFTIVIDGTVSFFEFPSSPNSAGGNDTTSSSFEGTISHSLIVYFTLWGAGNMEEKLEAYGLPSPTIMAVYVDGTMLMKENDDKAKGGLVPADAFNDSTAFDETREESSSRYSGRCLVAALIGAVVTFFP